MRHYKCLNQVVISNGNYSLVPIRHEDRYEILNWRNSQIDILRQESPLTIEQQDLYFNTVIAQLFEKEHPTQLLWSFLLNGKLIGYGGLVHIDWETKSAEISFLTETSRNKDQEVFISDWSNYLTLLKQIANSYLNFNFIFTYAYDIRPNLYIALENSGFKETQRIKNHIEINGELKDVVIHSISFNKLSMRLANIKDVDLYFKWANDALVRKFSFTQDLIQYNNHVKWFESKINDENYRFYIFENENKEPVGQVRINKDTKETIIGISIDEKYRGMNYGIKMINLACESFLSIFPSTEINAYIKETNVASINLFKKSGFTKIEELDFEGCKSLKLKKK